LTKQAAIEGLLKMKQAGYTMEQAKARLLEGSGV